MPAPVLARVEGDDLFHVAASASPTARGSAPPVARCGRQLVAYVQVQSARAWGKTRFDPTEAVPDGEGCHVCIPHKAHPLAPVWAACRRYDANANAAAAS